MLGSGHFVNSWLKLGASSLHQISSRVRTVGMSNIFSRNHFLLLDKLMFHAEHPSRLPNDFPMLYPTKFGLLRI